MKRVIVALSGGVDSSYAAWLLQRQGYAVEGLCLDLFEGSGAPAAAMEAGEKLGIRVHVKDCREVFRREVVDYFRLAYASGQTPNPCAACNPSVKFAALLQTAGERGAEAVATGHYARCRFDGETGRYMLMRAKDAKKDQSYFLFRLGQETLRRAVFPLGDMTKTEVRAGAAKAGLPSAKRRDSQDICFIPGGNYQRFLRSKKPNICSASESGLAPGHFVDQSGNVLGRHEGIACYTVGQRKRLGVTLKETMFVLALDPGRNQVILGPHEALYENEVNTASNSFVNGEAPTKHMFVTAKLRSGAEPEAALYYPLGEGRGRLVFEKPQRAATPGQCAVYYDGETVLGGGIIVCQAQAVQNASM